MVVPAGGRTVFLEDQGERPRVRAVGLVPAYAGSEYPAGFGQSHRRRRVRVRAVAPPRQFRAGGDLPPAGRDRWSRIFVPGTETAIQLPGLLSFAAVVGPRPGRVPLSARRQGLGFCRHRPGPRADAAGRLPVDRLARPAEGPRRVRRPGRPPARGAVVRPGRGVVVCHGPGRTDLRAACVCDGRIYFGCEDGYLYALGPGGTAALPAQDLGLAKIRHPAEQSRWPSRNTTGTPTTAISAARTPIGRACGRRSGSSGCGGTKGRSSTCRSAAAGGCTRTRPKGRSWRSSRRPAGCCGGGTWPGVHLSFTSPLYYRERLLVPQAGLKQSQLRCLDAATGRLLWESPFTGSPSWSRQGPPVVHENLAIYAFGSGQYAPQGTERAVRVQGQAGAAGRTARR